MQSGAIVILGSGVAGLSAARRLGLQGHRPLVVAPLEEPVSRGETLSHKALPLLERLRWMDLLDPATALPGLSRFSVWASQQLRAMAQHAAPDYHIDRRRFEARMNDSVGDQALRIAERAVSLHHAPQSVHVHLASGRTVEAPVLLDCTGRAALSSGPASQRRRIDRLVAAWRIVDLPPQVDTATATLVEAVERGWWYSAPLPSNRMMLGLFTDSDLVPDGISRNGTAWTELLADAPTTLARIDSLGLREGLGAQPPVFTPAASVTGSRIVEGRIVRVGDAAAALDPLGANGLASAIWSGVTAADAALAWLSGDAEPGWRYELAFLEGIAGHLSVQSALYRTERRFRNAPFWVRRGSQAAFQPAGN